MILLLGALAAAVVVIYSYYLKRRTGMALNDADLFVYIGTKNLAKTRAIRAVVDMYRERLLGAFNNEPAISKCKIEYVELSVESGVSANPRDWNETITGARNRAVRALSSNASRPKSVSIGIGIESGFISFEAVEGALFNFDVCCIARDQDLVYGFSQGTEYPRSPAERVLTSGADFDEQMTLHLGIAKPSPDVGFLGVLTELRYPRQHISQIATEHAVLRLIHKGDYYRAS